ncbi:amylo-alpha-1,6-glucosidase [Actinomadura scrupuli]|uniref:amylo-alpha-1,6-glucosidase n=1 Tax=Actinomadura scrupuli TaxID=559629 RepID=UPI003D996FF7
MSEPAAQEIPAAPSPGAVTLVEGTAFCVCGPGGDITPGGTEGIFFRDTRLLSHWELQIDGGPAEPMAVIPGEPFSATFVGRGRPRPGQAESTLLVTRARYVGGGMREDIVVRNLSREPAGLHLVLRAESDLADLFDVKAGLSRERGTRSVTAVEGGLLIVSQFRDRQRGVRVSATGATVSCGELAFRVAVPPRGTWETTVLVQPLIDGTELEPHFPTHHPIEHAGPARRQNAWERGSPTVSTLHPGLRTALRRSRADLGSLRIFDHERPDQPPAIAAGAPWFMTIFGRDSLISSWMTLPLDQSPALGTLRVLAELQGERVDPLSEEEPGKIMHELRHGVDLGLLHGRPRGVAYYGSVDATPLFVMLLGELRRWGLYDDIVEEMLPHADRALQWIEDYGDLDGDGFVEYRRKTDLGLVNQGWKDSFDGINFADGTLAQPPIALAEAQGYVYAAYVARAHFAREMGDEVTAAHYVNRAAALKRSFNEAFWLPDKGWYAVGLDRDKRPIDALASNMGHCLLTGILDCDKAPAVADRLMSPEMFAGWGVRTLASSMGAYNPMSYHNGSIWPHDNAVVAAGLMRYGFVEQAQRIALSLLDAAESFGGRLPELFCGFDRSEYRRPVPYPTSCSPQAWAAATPVHLLRVLLRFDPAIPHGKVWLAPVLPPELGDLRIDRFNLAGSRVSIHVADGRLEVTGLPPGIELVEEPRAPLTAALPPGEAA